MSVPTLPRRSGAMLTLGGLSLILTLVTGVGAEECGRNSRCGYGTRCDNSTSRCVCLSDNGQLKKREGNPVSVFYCLSEGVTECGDTLCGYRAVCDTNRVQCHCPSSNDRIAEVKGTSPSLWYCLETCDSAKSCPVNTTCTQVGKDNNYRCSCSEAATRSSTGQCLGEPKRTVITSTAHLVTEITSLPQGDTTEKSKSIFEVDNHELDATNKAKETIDNAPPARARVLAAGIGGVLILAIVVLVVAVVLARRRKGKRANNNGPDELRRRSAPPQHPRTPSHHTYQSVVDPPMLGPSGTDNPAGPAVIVRTEVSIISPTSRPDAYEDVDIDFPFGYSTVKVTGESDESKANQAQQASAINPPSQPADTVEPNDLNALYSNHTIPFNKAQQRHKNNQESSENTQNQYNSLYGLRPANDNADGAMEGNTQSARTVLKGDLEYDEIKLQKL